MYDEILLPTDGSSETLQTLEHTLEIANNNDARLHVIYVVDRRRYLAASPDTKEELLVTLREEGERAIDDVTVRAEEAGVETVTSLQEGIPYKDVLEYADSAGIDLITMGTHSRTGPDRIANLGSVTQRVVENAAVPVLVVNVSDAEA
jgi:nucleotide-binding universal stress UspA family protein